MSKEQLDEMIASYERLERVRLQEMEMSQAHLKMGIQALKNQTARNHILDAILAELKLFRATN